MSAMAPLTVPDEQEPQRPAEEQVAPEPQEPQQEPAAKKPAAEGSAETPQEPVAGPRRTVLPPDFDEKMLRLWKARADVLQTSRLDDMGRVVRPAIADPDEAMRAAINYFGRYVRGDGIEQEVRAYMDGGPMPRDWVPDNRPSKSKETYDREMLELRAQMGREQNPALAAAHDYILDPAGNIVPAFLQVFADTFVGLANFVTDVQPVNVTAALYGEETAKQRAATRATASFGSKTLHFGGDLGGQLPAYLLGGGAGAAVKGAGTVAKGNALLQAGKAAVLAPGTIMKAGGAVGSKALGAVGAKVAGKAGETIGKAVGHGAGGFGALGAVTDYEDRLAGAGMGAASGVVIGASSELAKAAFRGMFRTTYQQLGKSEQEAMDALKKWAQENKLYKAAGDTEEGYVKSVTNAFVDAGMPGLKGFAVKKAIGYAVQGGIESVGFSAIDHEFWHEAHEAVFNGDTEALANLGARLAGNAIALGAFHIPLRDVPAAQRRDQITPQGEAPKPPKPVETRTDESPAPQEPQRGGIVGDPVFTKLEGEPAPKPVDPGTMRTAADVIDKATGTIVGGPAPLERLGWRDVFPEAASPGGVRLGEQSEPAGHTFELPGTPYRYEVTGETATPNPALASLLGIREPMPLATFEGALEHFSLLSALQAKTLPGVEISADGIKAIGTDGVRDGTMRTVRMGEVLESPLSATPQWKAIDKAPTRGKDSLEPDQQQVVAVLKSTLSQAENLPQADRVMLSSIVEVLDTVAARNDKSVAETIAALPKMVAMLGETPTPEHTSRVIKAVAESLTTKTPEKALADMATADRSGERGAADLGVVTEPAAKGVRFVAERAAEAVDAVFRDQIRSIEKRGGDPELATGMRRAASESRTSIGKVTDTFSEAEAPIRENPALMQMVEVDGVTKPRWDALLHREIEPANEAEAKAAETMNRTLLDLWEIERQSGALLSRPGMEAMGEPPVVWFERSAGRTQSKLPRVWAEGKQEVYEDTAARKRWFETLEELNPGLSAEALEKSYQNEIKATEIKQADRDSSFEHIRHIEKVPYEFEGKQMLERDPFEAMRRIIAEQASRAAVIKEFGQEGAPENQQREVRTRLGLNPEAKGTGNAIEKWFKALPKQNPEAKKQAVETMLRLQAKEPKPLGRGLDKTRRAMGIRRAAMTMLSGLRDIPSMFTEGAQWGGLRNMAKAFDAVARNYPEERKRAERLGTLLHEIGNLNLHEATDPLNKAADMLGEFGNVPGIKMLAPRATERFRTVMMSKVADLVLKDWAEGTGRDGSRQVLKELDFNEADAAALSSGTASEALQNRFRHQLVQRAMSRGRSAERSRFSASPHVQALVDFTGYASKRAYGIAREAKTAVETFKPGSEATLADKAAIAKRLATRVTGLVAGGMLGDLLYYIVADGLEGKNGWNHYMRDLLTYPGKTITKGAMSGLLSGPLAVLYRAATGSPSEVGEAASQLTVPTGLAANMLRAAHDATTPKGWLETFYDFVSAFGVIPQSSRLKSLGGYLSGAALGENTEFRDDAKLVSQFRQQEGMASVRPTFDKQPAFYAALGKIRDHIDKADMKLAPEAAAKQVRAAADAAIREALALQPEENVAAAVRGMQHAENVDKQRLMDYVRDEKRFERMMMHDQMVSELAEAIGREQGTNPTPFEERLAGAAKIAAGKARNAWGKLASDTIEDVAAARLHGQPVGTALRDLANRMSLHPDSLQVDDTLGDKDKKRLSRMSTQNQRQRFLEGVFRERVQATIERMRERR